MNASFMKSTASIFLMAGLLSMPVNSAWAFGESSDSDAKKKETCPKGELYDKKKKNKDGKLGGCVPAKDKSASLTDDIIFDNGEALALTGRYEEAIDILTLAANRNDPRILNYLGYSHRKLGRVEVGLGYYREALRLNENYTLARSYMGEAFLQLNDVKAANEQLQIIASVAGKDAREYKLLNASIEAFKRGETTWN